MSQPTADVPALLSKLISVFISKSGPASAEESRHQHAYLLRYASSVLGSSVYSHSSLEGGGDEAGLVQILKKELEATGKNDKAEKLVAAVGALAPGPGRPGLDARARAALLVLLRRLRADGRDSQGVGRVLPLARLSQSIQLGGLPASLHPAPAAGLHHHHQHQLPPRPASAASVYGNVVRPSYVVTPSEFGDDPLNASLSSEPSRLSAFNSQYTMDGPGHELPPASRGAAQAAVYDALSEPALVRDVLYAAQGVPGSAVQWRQGPPAGEQGFRLLPEAAAGLGPSRKMLVERLTELGWLFCRVRRHISDCCDAEGSLRQALGAALSGEVADFYRLMALLEGQAQLPLPTPGDPDGAGGGQFLTLRRLVPWLSEPLRRMRLLAALGDAAEGLEGGELATVVYEYTRHGDPFVAAAASKLLQQVCVPLHAMIRRWVLEGELDDPHGEFFVVRAAGVTAAVNSAAGTAAAAPPPLDLWNSTYQLHEERLPPFIGRPLAQRILRAGKAIHYLNLACGDGGWVQQRAEALAARVEAVGLGGRPGGSMDAELLALEGLVSSAVRAVDGRLLAVLWRRYRLRAHFAAIRRFLLLGQGDWVTAFIDLAHAELDKPAHEVSEVFLNSCLRQALTATTVLGGAAGTGAGAPGGAAAAVGAGASGVMGAGAELEGPGAGAEEEDDAAVAALAERLRVRKERAAGAGEVGWDVFSLSYNPAAPGPGGGGAAGGAAGPLAAGSGGALGALFTPEALRSYNRLARLLWRLKRSEHALGSSWAVAACGMQRSIDRIRGPERDALQRLLAALLRLRSEMSHFATNLQYYVQFEVMEASWQDFYARAASSSDLDGLISAHEQHLATLLRKALLNEREGQGPPAAAPAGPRLAAAGPSAPGTVRDSLQDALTNMLGLRALVGQLNEQVESARRKSETEQRRARAAVAKGGWGTSGAGAEGQGPLVEAGVVEDLRRRVGELALAHNKAVGEFTERLPEEAQDDVRFLLARLDFSARPGTTRDGAFATAD